MKISILLKNILNFTITIFIVSCTFVNAQSYQWAHGFSTTLSRVGVSYKVVIDYTQSDIYNVGKVETNGNTPIDFDPSPNGIANLLTTTNKDNGFISKYTSSGNFLLAMVFKGDPNEVLNIAVDNSDNMYVTGYYTGVVDFDPSPTSTFTLPAAVNKDIFIVKIHSNGTFAWAKNISSAGNDIGNSITLDASNNVIVGGTFEGTADFNPGTPTVNLVSNGIDGFIIKLDGTGNYLNAIKLGASGDDGFRDVEVDSNNDLFACGYYSSSSAFSGASHAGGIDGFIGKFSTANLSPVWIKGFGGTENDQPLEVAQDGIGSIHCVGYFSGNADFDPNVGVTSFTTTSATDLDGFIMKLNASGNLSWAKQLTGSNNQVPMCIGVDNLGDVYVGGSYTNVTDFNPSSAQALQYTSPSFSNDMFVLKLNPSGNYIQSQVFFGYNGNEVCHGIAVEPNTGFYVITGYSGRSTTVDFNTSASATNTLSVDWFLAKYNKCSYSSMPSLASKTICSGSSATYTYNIVGSSSLGWYSSPSSTISITSSSVFTTPTLTTNATYYLDYTNSCGTTAKYPFETNVIKSPTLSISSPSNTFKACEGTSFSLTASGADTYTWLPSGINTASIVVTPTTNATYTLQGKWNACTFISNTAKTLTVVEYPDINLTIFSTQTVICAPGQSVTLKGTVTNTAPVIGTYTWQPGNSNSFLHYTVSPTSSQVYSLSINNQSLCASTSTVLVNVGSYPTVTASSSSPLICSGNNATLTANGANTYDWRPIDFSINTYTGSVVVANPNSTRTYTVFGTSSIGCKSSATLTQSVSVCTGIDNTLIDNQNIAIILSPNPFNDELLISSNQLLQKIVITDMLGKQVLVIDAVNGEVTQIINTTELRTGVYMIIVYSNNQSRAYKLIKN